ncbi:hypothetical protein ACOQFV_27325 [Nocardiopsis changdeensis]|uniref:Uncharacterized protein n=1 Tax=Nocardiopsis changdeensis TaxID=2831969 RepID=A0ABX8BL84_9ACTN|nr:MULTISPECIES: hypothetical protein [Nocardiopsis]QUX22980.1 hypothetical protein KGD84_00785 [Nocardiopsis changdeensis]QYX38923.1 hypothetical protein K1J57_10235 [Nocardiopsis sp. MT53]
MDPYATVTELNAYLDEPVDNPERMLNRASRRVRGALLSAIYDRTEPDTAAALRDATLELCAWWADNGMDGSEQDGGIGDPRAWTSVAAGPISLGGGRTGGAGGGQASATAAAAARAGLPEQSYLILQQAGLTGHGPRTGPPGWWC